MPESGYISAMNPPMNNLSILVNRSTLKSLLCCMLVTAVLGCHKDISPEPNLANCHIVKETIKSNRGRYKDQPETITIEDKQIIVFPRVAINYSYDEVGRLVKGEIEPDPGKEAYWTSFSYSPTSITRVDHANVDPNDASRGLTNYSSVIPLDDRGLDARNQYDAEGFKVDPWEITGKLERTRLNGNLVKSITYVSDMTLYMTYIHDTTRRNLPNMYPFNGRIDNNLLTQYIAYSPNATYYKSGELYRVNYYYEFDRYGRVTRQISAFRNDYNSGWPYLPDGAETVVHDYEYECL